MAEAPELRVKVANSMFEASSETNDETGSILKKITPTGSRFVLFSWHGLHFSITSAMVGLSEKI